MTAALQKNMEYIQATPEWLALRKTKITATDAPIIMGASHWKTRVQLYHEKIQENTSNFVNERMQRGIDLEPIARDLFTIKTGIHVEPRVVVKDWAMASLDGISACGNYIVEIKCPGEKDHAVAVSGKIPDHYYPQLQHQMWVCGLDYMYYFSFDGADGVVVTVERDYLYCGKMIDEEMKFYDCLINKIPPEPSEGDYIERSDDLWCQCAMKWRLINQNIKNLEKEEEELRNQLIFLSGESNTKGAGISLCQVRRKGNLDYPKMIKQLDVDDEFVEKFRKENITSWRLMSV